MNRLLNESQHWIGVLRNNLPENANVDIAALNKFAFELLQEKDNILSTENKSIYYDAAKKWGEPIQKVMAMEEFSELIKGISKNLRNGDKEYMIEGMADSMIMMEQLFCMLESKDRQKIKEVYNKKINNLKLLLKQ